LKAGEVGELAGVSGNTIGQWARWGYIRASVSDGDPHVYSLEDVLEAAVVQQLLARGVAHAQVRRAIARLDGEWPLQDAALATTPPPRPKIVLRDDDGVYALSQCGWQRMVAPPPLQDVRVRLKRSLRKPG
jgi:DNA-binding transcriptional MerR regulator